MAVKSIIKFPDPILRKVSENVNSFDSELHKLIEDMLDTMYEVHGIGLAAPQIGVLKRVIVADIEQLEGKRNPVILINGVIMKREGLVEFEEGCLSVPGIREVVKRSERIKVHGFNEKGEKIAIEADGMLSIVLQHELDHLDGLLFIDRLPRGKRELIKKMIMENREALLEKLGR